MFKYSRIQKKIPPQLVCGSHGTYLDCMLPGVHVTTGLGFSSVLMLPGAHVTAELEFSSVFKSFIVMVKIVTPCFNRPSLPSRSLVG